MTKPPTRTPAVKRSTHAHSATPAPKVAPERPNRSAAPTAPVKKVKRPMADNPQIGYLTPEEFERIGQAALGGRGWQKAFTRGTGMAQTTVTRYLRAILPIPKHVALLMHMLQTLRLNELPVPDEFFDPDQPKKP